MDNEYDTDDELVGSSDDESEPDIPDWMDTLTTDKIIDKLIAAQVTLVNLKKFKNQPELLRVYQAFVVSTALNVDRAQWALPYLSAYLDEEIGRTTSNKHFENAHEYLKERLDDFRDAIGELRRNDALRAALSKRNYASKQAQRKMEEAIEREKAKYRTEHTPVQLAAMSLKPFENYRLEIMQVVQVLTDLKDMLKWDTNPKSHKLDERKALWESKITGPTIKLGNCIGKYKAVVLKWQKISKGGSEYTIDMKEHEKAKKAVEQSAQELMNSISVLQKGLPKISNVLQQYAYAKAAEKYAADYSTYDPKFNEGMLYFNTACQTLGVASTSVVLVFPPLAAIPLSLSLGNFLTNQIAPRVRAKRKLKNNPRAAVKVLMTATSAEKKSFSTAGILPQRFEQHFGGAKDQVLNANTLLTNATLVSDAAGHAGSQIAQAASGVLNNPAFAPFTPLAFGATMTLAVMRANQKELIQQPGAAQLLQALTSAGQELKLTDNQIRILGPDDTDPTKWKVSLNGHETTFDPQSMRFYNTEAIFRWAWGSESRDELAWSGQLPNIATDNYYNANVWAKIYSEPISNLYYDAIHSCFYATMEAAFTIYVTVGGEDMSLTDGGWRRRVIVSLSVAENKVVLYDPNQDDLAQDVAHFTVPTSFAWDVMSDAMLLDEQNNPFLAQGYYASIQTGDYGGESVKFVQPNNPVPDVDKEYFMSWRVAAEQKLKDRP